MSSVHKDLNSIGDPLRSGRSIRNAVPAEKLNALGRVVQGLARGDNIRTGRGVRKIAVADGVLLSPYRVHAANRGAPFDIYVKGTNASFSPGTINGLIPSNLGTGVTITGSGTEYLVLNVTTSSGQVTAASVAKESSQPGAIQPTLGLPPTVFKLLLGLTVDGTAFKIWGNGNIQAHPRESFRLQKIVSSAGELPYDIYYTWNFSLL